MNNAFRTFVAILTSYNDKVKKYIRLRKRKGIVLDLKISTIFKSTGMIANCFPRHFCI